MWGGEFIICYEFISVCYKVIPFKIYKNFKIVGVVHVTHIEKLNNTYCAISHKKQ